MSSQNKKQIFNGFRYPRWHSIQWYDVINLWPKELKMQVIL